MGSTHATRHDILLLKRDLELLQSSLTIRLGSTLIVGLGILFAALKLT